MHGTTVVINALTERTGARTALVTTSGFRDVLEIGRGNRPDMYNLVSRKPPPFVPRRHRFEVRERVDRHGSRPRPARPGGRRADRGGLRARRDRGRRRLPPALLRPSRARAGALRSAAGAAARRRRDRLVRGHARVARVRAHEHRRAQRLRAAGGRPLPRRAGDAPRRRRPARTAARDAVERGHGLAGSGARAADRARRVGAGGRRRRRGADRRAHRRAESHLPRHRRHDGEVLAGRGRDGADHDRVPHRVAPGLGGLPGDGAGRRHRRDRRRRRLDRPASTPAARSSSARRARAPIPGPPCYGRGGTEPTVTDAKLVAGVLAPDYFLGGRLEVRPELAREALRALGEPLGHSVEALANGIIRLADANMISALKLVSVQRGRDPRDFALLVGGGGGGMHGAALGAELEVRKVIVPPLSGVFSAWGMCMTAPRADVVRTHILSAGRGHRRRGRGALRGARGGRGRDARARRHRTAGEAVCTRAVDARYRGQEHTVRVPVAGGPISAAALEADFHELHRRTYTFDLEGDSAGGARHLPRLGVRPRAARGGASRPVGAPPDRPRRPSARASSTSTSTARTRPPSTSAATCRSASRLPARS